MFIMLSTDFGEGWVDENLTLSTNRNVLVERVRSFMKSLFLLLLLVCVCVYLCVSVCSHVHTCACTCVLKAEFNGVYSLNSFSTLYFVLSLNLELARSGEISWPTSPKHPPISTLLSVFFSTIAESTSSHSYAWPFKWRLGIGTYVLMIMGQVLYLIELPPQPPLLFLLLVSDLRTSA